VSRAPDPTRRTLILALVQLEIGGLQVVSGHRRTNQSGGAVREYAWGKIECHDWLMCKRMASW